MAVSLKISVQGYDRATHVVTMDDDTGVYHVTTNPTGYGAPNAERNTLALVLSATQKSGSEVVQWSDPITDTEFDFDFNNDGVYAMYLCSVEWEAGAYDPTAMSVDRVFYSVLDDKIYKVVLVNGVNTVEETNDVYANSIQTTTIIEGLTQSTPNYLVISYVEEKKREMWCGEMTPCFTCPSREYIDLVKCIEVSECYYESLGYIPADDVLVFTDKIKKQ